MKRRAFTLIQLMIVVAVIGLIAAILFPIFARSPEPRRGSCQNNLKQIGLALAQYSQDWDERLPLIVVREKEPYGWADALTVYSKSAALFQCPSEPQQYDWQNPSPPTARGYTDYWFNANVAGRKLEDVRQPATAIAFGDGNDGQELTDARYNLGALPASWLSAEKSPAKRHLDMANYCFLDGHVKAVAPDKLGVAPQNYSFALR
jgi:prepilin-type processing-associated H-X9-DG protein